MEEARYGRLRLGRCVTHDYGFLGCSSSVLDLLDRTCSGRRWCQFDIPLLRDLVHPCPKDLTCYLEATYRCVTGMGMETYVEVVVGKSHRKIKVASVSPGCRLKMWNCFQTSTIRPEVVVIEMGLRLG